MKKKEKRGEGVWLGVVSGFGTPDTRTSLKKPPFREDFCG
jgi:hypothetical protein